ncbi:MAG: hypothetical protein AAFQ89_08915 [Cyanobacteria bacterium J06626_18]
MPCPKCGSSRLQKNGFRRGRQQYRCKDCKRQFTETLLPRGYSEDARQICLRMYRLGLALREIERLTGISRSTVSSWIRQQDPDSSDDDALDVTEESEFKWSIGF